MSLSAFGTGWYRPQRRSWEGSLPLLEESIECQCYFFFRHLIEFTSKSCPGILLCKSFWLLIILFSFASYRCIQISYFFLEWIGVVYVFSGIYPFPWLPNTDIELFAVFPYTLFVCLFSGLLFVFYCGCVIQHIGWFPNLGLNPGLCSPSDEA